MSNDSMAMTTTPSIPKMTSDGRSMRSFGSGISSALAALTGAAERQCDQWCGDATGIGCDRGVLDRGRRVAGAFGRRNCGARFVVPEFTKLTPGHILRATV